MCHSVNNFKVLNYMPMIGESYVNYALLKQVKVYLKWVCIYIPKIKAA